MMAVAGSVQFSHYLGFGKSYGHNKLIKNLFSNISYVCSTCFSCLADAPFLIYSLEGAFITKQDFWSIRLLNHVYRPVHAAPYRYNGINCHSLPVPGKAFGLSRKAAVMTLTRSYGALQGNPLVLKLVPAAGIIIFAVWGLGPLLRQGRILFLHKNDSNWKKSGTHFVMTSYLQPLLLWAGAILICRALEPVIPLSEAGQVIKKRLLNFVGSLSTVLAFAYCLSSVIKQAQQSFMPMNDCSDARNMGFQFAGKAVYSAVWVAAVSLFMELLGFSTQKWLTAGGLGTVLLTLAGREIFTNFLSSAMIHATRPFVANEWIQTKIEGQEVSGTVEHVGWWSQTVVRGENREAVHIPNHKFTMNVVRNLSQKSHWRIKTHLALSHLDFNKINNIVADMRKVLAKNPQVEQQRLHRRVFLDSVNTENQGLLILVSCFVKTSHFEEYLCVKEAILLDLIRVISHHRARLATPIRTVQKIYSESGLENVPAADSIFTHGGAVSSRPLLLIDKIKDADKTKARPTPGRTNSEHDSKATVRPTPDSTKVKSTSISNSKAKEAPSRTTTTKEKDAKTEETTNTYKDLKGVAVAAEASTSDSNVAEKVRVNSKFTPTADVVDAESLSSEANNKQPKKTYSGTAKQNAKMDGSISLLEPGAQTKQDAERTPVVPHPARLAFEDNIVLGVALEGSKRTLPIGEVTARPTDIRPGD